MLRLLPEAGVQLRTLAGAAGALPARTVDLPAGSWGSGKDFRVWQVEGMREGQQEIAERLLAVVDKADGSGVGADNDPALDQLARTALLALASDWPFCVAKDSAADYAWQRFTGHAADFRRLADALESRDGPRAARIAIDLALTDRPFGHLDARGLHTTHR